MFWVHFDLFGRLTETSADGFMICVCVAVALVGGGGRWWQPTAGFMTMHAVTCRLTA